MLNSLFSSIYAWVWSLPFVCNSGNTNDGCVPQQNHIQLILKM
jgi:hypothetical protein